MGHSHSHEGGHSHHGQINIVTNITKAFIIGIVLNLIFIIVEVIIGLSIHSVSLLSDAGHNLADVGSLALSLLAFKLLKVRSNERYTYGYRKTTVLTALLNAVILLISVGAILIEAINHFFHPLPLPGKTIAFVAAFGIVINGISALFFLREKDQELNSRSAYLHLLSDTLVSFGLVVGGTIIYYTSWFWLDPVLSIIIAVTILVSTWNLLKESLRLSLDAVPKEINLEQIKREALEIDGIKDIFHIHIWAMSTAENAMTAHLVLRSDIDKVREGFIKHELRHRMEHMNIQHLTVETELESGKINEKSC